MEKKERTITERQLKVLILIFVIAAIVILLVWTMVPGRIYEVSDLSERSELVGEPVKAKGLVRDWSSGDDFTLADSFDDGFSILIHYDGAYPDGFDNNETVVVEGKLESNGGILTIVAAHITIGCPSKY